MTTERSIDEGVPTKGPDRVDDRSVHPTSSSVHRMLEPEDTLRQIAPAIERCGITRLADVTGLDEIGIPVAQAVRPNARSLSVAQGKGTTLAAAYASAAMESIEFHHAEHCERPLVLASRVELTRRGHELDHVDLLARREGSIFHEHLRIPWVEGHGVRSGRPTLVPFQMIDIDLVPPRPYTAGCFYGGTNGLASGNCREEAIAHALSELIERDARSLWVHRGHESSGATKVDLDTVDDPHLRALTARFDDADVALHVWDMTSDLRVAAFSAVAVSRVDDGLRRVPMTGGHGCHLDRTVALRRAITEVAQARITGIAAVRDDISRESMERGRDVTVQRNERVRLDALSCERAFSQVPHHTNAFVEDDIDDLAARIERAGIPEPIVVDLTGDLGVPVVKVIGPGLEPNPTERVLPGPRLTALFERRSGPPR